MRVSKSPEERKKEILDAAKSNVPHFVQMHVGEIDEAEIANFSANNRLVKEKQVVELLQIDRSNIHYGNSHGRKETSG